VNQILLMLLMHLLKRQGQPDQDVAQPGPGDEPQIVPSDQLSPSGPLIDLGTRPIGFGGGQFHTGGGPLHQGPLTNFTQGRPSSGLGRQSTGALSSTLSSLTSGAQLGSF
jgi:hypothetical protein